MVFLWFRVEVSAWDCRRALTILQEDLVDRLHDVRGHPERIIAEIAPDRRRKSKAQAIWMKTTREVWVGKGSLWHQVVGKRHGWRGSKWWIDEDVLDELQEGIDMEHATTLLEDVWRKRRISLDSGSFAMRETTWSMDNPSRSVSQTVLTTTLTTNVSTPDLKAWFQQRIDLLHYVPSVPGEPQVVAQASLVLQGYLYVFDNGWKAETGTSRIS